MEYATSDSVTVFADVPLEQAVSTPAVKVATTATMANSGNLLRTVPIGVFDPLVNRTAHPAPPFGRWREGLSYYAY